MAKYKTIIGRAETVDFPARFLTDIPAKTDTGAFSSSVHATNIREVKGKNGKISLKFTLLDHPTYSYSREIEVQSFDKTIVENSFGERQSRYKIDLKVRLAGKVFRTSFTLADRSTKTFPVLIGRTMLNKRYIVDTSIANIDKKHLKQHLKSWIADDDKTDKDMIL